jgi:Thiolase, C-terminal domain
LNVQLTSNGWLGPALAPRIMGIGPALAIPKVLDLVGITKEDVDLYEINEAFASMASLFNVSVSLAPSANTDPHAADSTFTA